MTQREKKAIQAWFNGPEVAEIDRWRRAQDEIPSLADAMRQLVRRGIKATEAAAKARRSATAAE